MVSHDVKKTLGKRVSWIKRRGRGLHTDLGDMVESVGADGNFGGKKADWVELR